MFHNLLGLLELIPTISLHDCCMRCTCVCVHMLVCSYVHMFIHTCTYQGHRKMSLNAGVWSWPCQALATHHNTKMILYSTSRCPIRSSTEEKEPGLVIFLTALLYIVNQCTYYAQCWPHLPTLLLLVEYAHHVCLVDLEYVCVLYLPKMWLAKYSNIIEHTFARTCYGPCSKLAYFLLRFIYSWSVRIHLGKIRTLLLMCVAKAQVWLKLTVIFLRYFLDWGFPMLISSFRSPLFNTSRIFPFDCAKPVHFFVMQKWFVDWIM